MIKTLFAGGGGGGSRARFWILQWKSSSPGRIGYRLLRIRRSLTLLITKRARVYPLACSSWYFKTGTRFLRKVTNSLRAFNYSLGWEQENNSQSSRGIIHWPTSDSERASIYGFGGKQKSSRGNTLTDINEAFNYCFRGKHESGSRGTWKVGLRRGVDDIHIRSSMRRSLSERSDHVIFYQ